MALSGIHGLPIPPRGEGLPVQPAPVSPTHPQTPSPAQGRQACELPLRSHQQKVSLSASCSPIFHRKKQ